MDNQFALNRVLRRALCLAVASSALLGCGSDSDDPKGITFAFIPKTSNNLVFTMGNEGAQFAARDLTASSGRKVSVDYLASDGLDPAVEQGFVRQAIDDKVDGMLVSCIDDSMTAPINEAVAANIPVVTFDSDCPDSERLGFYSMQSEATGEKGADLLAAALGAGPKTVAILNGREGADNLERRAKGFTDRMAAEYPNIEIVTTVHCLETGESCGPMLEEDIIEAYPDLDGLFVVGLWGILAACTCDATGNACSCDDSQLPKWKAAGKGKLKTVAYDTLPFELELMRQGYISALLGQKYFGWGYDTVNLLFDHLTAGRRVSGFLDSGFDVVCPNNVDDMQAKWQAKDFRREPSPACDL
jgi:ribose transport system substrate-binding protein